VSARPLQSKIVESRWIDNDLVLTTNTKGKLQVWHAMMGTVEKEVQVGEDPLLCSDYSKLLKRAVVGRQSSVLNVYDVETMQLASVCQNTIEAHTNRVFCTRFD